MITAKMLNWCCNVGYLYFCEQNQISLLKTNLSKYIYVCIPIYCYFFFILLNRRSETFWTTTGMFPQEFIISFHKSVHISKLTIQCNLGKMFFLNQSFCLKISVLGLSLSNFPASMQLQYSPKVR